MISKTKLVNTLFLLGFPCYGIGTYMSFKGNYSVGVISAVSPFILILLFYFVDLIYRGRIQPMVNRVYWMGMAFIASLMFSMWVAYSKHLVGLNPINTTSQCIMFLVPFNAAVVVHVYNRANDDFDFSKLIFNGLSLLIGVNVLGYAAGLRNLVHGFPGRINMPFMGGIYDASHLMSILCIMLLFYIRDFTRKPFQFFLFAGFYMVNMYVMMNINSRLSMIIFFVMTLLFITKAIRTLRGLYAISLFTMPLMMSFTQLIYIILTQPFFVAIVHRVSKEDVTTFNGRTHIWERIAKWAFEDRRGIVFGNGYHGQYTFHMLDFVSKKWSGHGSATLHLHSTFLETLMDQGLVGLFLLYGLFWYGYTYYRNQYLTNSQLAPLFGALVYLMFIWQIDIFCYGTDIGYPIVFCLLSAVAIDPKYITRRQRDLNGAFLP